MKLLYYVCQSLFLFFNISVFLLQASFWILNLDLSQCSPTLVPISYISYFSLTIIKHHTRSNLGEEGFFWSTVKNVACQIEKAWSQKCEAAVNTGSVVRKQSADSYWCWVTKSQGSSHSEHSLKQCPSSCKFQNLPQQWHHPGTNIVNTWAYRGHFTFKPQVLNIFQRYSLQAQSHGDLGFHTWSRG